MEEFVLCTYTLLDCAIGFDVDDVSNSVGFQVRAQSDHALRRRNPSVIETPLIFLLPIFFFGGGDSIPSCDERG